MDRNSGESLQKTKGTDNMEGKLESRLYKADSIHVCKHKDCTSDRIYPVFPGTNCEYDSPMHLRRAGAEVDHKGI